MDLSNAMAKLVIAVEAVGAKPTADQLKQVANAATQVTRGANTLRKELGETGKQIDRTNKSAKELKKELTASSGRLKVIGRDINRYITLPFLAFSAASVKFSLDLNQGLGNVEALLIGNRDRIFELKEGVKDLARETGKSFADINAGLYRTISVFQDGEDSVSRLNTAIRVGIAGYASTEDAVQLLSAVTRAYGDTTAQAVERVADLAFETVRLGDTTIPALSAAMQVATDRADRLNVSQEELFAVFSTLTGITGDASMVATQFRSAMDDLLNPTDALAALLKSMGFETGKAALESMGLLGVIKSIANAAEASGQPLQDYIKRKEGMTLVSRLAGAQMTDFATKLEQISTRTGAATQAFDQVTEGVAKFNFQLNQNKMRMQVALSDIGDKMLPTIVALSSAVVTLVEVFAGLPDILQTTVAILFVVVSGFGAVAQIMGVIKSLQIAGVFVNIGSALSGIAIGATTLNVVLGATLGIFGAIVAIAAVVSLAHIASQKSQQEAVEATNSVLRDQNDLLSRASSLTRSNIIQSQSLAVTYQQQFAESGRIPVITTQQSGNVLRRPQGDVNLSTFVQGRTVAGSGRPATPSFIDVNKDTPIATLNRLQEQYKTKLEDFRKQNELISDQIENVRSEISTTTGQLTEMMNKEVRFAIQSATWNFDPTSFVQADKQSQFNMLEAVKSQMSWDDVFAAEWGIQGSVKETIIDLQTIISNSIMEETKLNTLSDLLTRTGGPEMEGQIVGSINHIASFLINSGKIKKTWQEWFSEITGVSLESIRWSGGIDVATKYGEFLQEQFDLEVAFAEAFGMTPNTTKIIEDEITTMMSHIRDLFEKANRSGDINTLFSFMDNLFTSDPGLANRYFGRISDLAKSTASDFRKAWQEQEESVNRLSGLLRAHGIEVEDTALTYEDWEDRLYAVDEAMTALKAEGLKEGTEGYDELNNVILEIIQNMAKANEEANKFKFGYTPTEAPTVTGEGVFKAFVTDSEDPLGQKLRDEIALRDELNARKEKSNDLNDEQTKQLEDLELSLEKSAKALSILSDLMAEFLNGVLSATLDGFWQMGSALATMSGDGAKMGDVFAEWGMQILRMLPQLFLTAGLQMLVMGNIPLGLGLIALGFGTALLGGFAEGVVNSSSTTSANAKGGILSSATMSGNTLAGEAGREAILPLAYNSNGELGVKSAGSGSGAHVNVIIHNYAGVEVQEETNENGDLQIFIRKAVKGIVGGGDVDKEMRDRYNIRSIGRA